MPTSHRVFLPSYGTKISEAGWTFTAGRQSSLGINDTAALKVV